MDDYYVSNLLGVDFTVYSKKAMRQCMEYAGWHRLFIDIMHYPKMTQFACGHSPNYTETA